MATAASAQVLHEAQKLMPSDGASGDRFGITVSISGDAAVLGSSDDNANGNESGSAYVFRWNGVSWVEEQKLLASDGDEGDHFGSAVVISGDVIIVGAFPAAYVFRWNGSSWTQEQKLLRSGLFAVAMSGNVALVGTYVFRWNGLSWVEEQELVPSDSLMPFGYGTSVAVSGDVAIVGAYGDDENGDGAGSAYIFRRNGVQWVEEQKLLASDAAEIDLFGIAVSISGDMVVVGAWGADAAYVFSWNGATWVEEQKLVPADVQGNGFGYSVSISGESIVVGAVFDSEIVLFGGAAYAFRWNGASWVQKYKLLATSSEAPYYFGNSVSVSGNVALVGSPYLNGNSDSGAAYVFNLPCDPGRYGPMCTECPGGASNPCNGHGTCDDGADGTGTCTCNPGYSGPTCTPLPGGACCSGSVCTQTSIDLCSSVGGEFHPGAICQGVSACCLPDQSCVDLDATCCHALGGIPAGAGLLCDNDEFPGCVAAIPTVSAWGLLVLTLLTLTGAKLAFRPRGI